ncbi:MAG: hypothetical protein IH892_13325, partial [Planctomycetes bacterium]|nr:hypothetical protein [Planctomycetota bacterium]
MNTIQEVDTPTVSGKHGSETIQMVRGQFEVSIRPGLLPAEVIQANEAVRQGKAEDARSLLSQDLLRQVEVTVEKEPPATELCLIVARLLFDCQLYDRAEPWYR